MINLSISTVASPSLMFDEKFSFTNVHERIFNKCMPSLFVDTNAPTVCCAIDNSTNSIGSVTATITQEGTDPQTDSVYLLVLGMLLNDISNNKIKRENFSKNFIKLTNNDLQQRIKKTIPQIKTSLDKKDIEALQEVFSFSGQLVNNVITAKDYNEQNGSFSDKEKLEILKSLNDNLENIWKKCNESLPQLNKQSQIEFAKCFSYFEDWMRMSAMIILESSETLNQEEKKEYAKIFGENDDDKEKLIQQNENKRINDIKYKEINSYLEQINLNYGYYKFLFC